MIHLEDTSATDEELTEHFGCKHCKSCCAASEPDKSLPWEERKQHTIEMLKNASLEEIQIISSR